MMDINVSAPGAQASLRQRIDSACEAACGAIAPSWPLDRAIAVNPHWERTHKPVRDVAARMAVLAGIGVFPTRRQMLAWWEEGRFAAADLEAALERLPQARDAGWNVQHCIEALHDAPRTPRLPLLIDALDDDPQRHARLSWRQAITHQVSQVCAAYFDTWQAEWQAEPRTGLYDFWRDTLRHDHGIGTLMGLPSLRSGLGALPPTSEEAEAWVLDRLGIAESAWADYLEAVLLTVQGWASWCAYLGWQAKLEGRMDGHLRELLAIRLAWGALLLECKDDGAAQSAFTTVQAAWRNSAVLIESARQALLPDEILQLALDLGYQRELREQLACGGHTPDDPPEVQAAFCIDVRSEPLRRALEVQWPAVQTLGFAGFFGLPISYTPLGTRVVRPQLPGLLAPSMQASERLVPAGHDEPSAALDADAAQTRSRRLAWTRALGQAVRWPAAAFAAVECAGFGEIGALARWLRPSERPRSNDDLDGLPARLRPLCRPQLSDMTLQAKVELAASVLRAMGLQRDVAPLVLLVAHASQTCNNAHAAALECGACSGNSGEVNARALAHLLNEKSVRDGLRTLGIDIPQHTAFVGALHNTTTDEVEAFDVDLLAPQVQARWQRLNGVLRQACDQVRRERAARRGVNPQLSPQQLLGALRRRANDGAQTRPEWGLAGNAAIMIAPRSRSRGAHLGGRCFLHAYDSSRDPDGSLLEALMTAPLLVAHWINGQYHASTSDPDHMGSGNKILHNVVAGRVGVFEGNGGDLRIGLSRQSLHDGKRWTHEPVRLNVLIEAAQETIERVLQRHVRLRQLVDNAWIHLLRVEPSGKVLWRKHAHMWLPC